MMTCNSLLLSKGNILTRTRPSGTSATEISSSTATPMKEQGTIAHRADQRRHNTSIEPGSPVLGLRFQYLCPGKISAQQPHCGPGRDHKSYQQREEHRRRRPHRNGPHVRPHQSAHECHGQHRGNHGECGQDGGVAHLGDSLDGNFTASGVPGFPAAGSGAPCFLRRRWRRRRGCRC